MSPAIGKGCILFDAAVAACLEDSSNSIITACAQRLPEGIRIALDLIRRHLHRQPGGPRADRALPSGSCLWRTFHRDASIISATRFGPALGVSMNRGDPRPQGAADVRIDEEIIAAAFRSSRVSQFVGDFGRCSARSPVPSACLPMMRQRLVDASSAKRPDRGPYAPRTQNRRARAMRSRLSSWTIIKETYTLFALSVIVARVVVARLRGARSPASRRRRHREFVEIVLGRRVGLHERARAMIDVEVVECWRSELMQGCDPPRRRVCAARKIWREERGPTDCGVSR